MAEAGAAVQSMPVWSLDELLDCRMSAVVRNSRSSSSSGSALPTWMTVKPADSRQSPFYELELMELCDGIGKTRVRQHVNPLRREFQQPTAAPDWSALFTDPSLPLALDIGSGYGRFLLLLQRNNPDHRVNYLGLEIRRTLVDRANEWVARLGLQGRVHYVFTNATVSLATLLGSYPGPISDVFIQFPDPHFKRRHHKRRVVQPHLVAALRALMPPGGEWLTGRRLALAGQRAAAPGDEWPAYRRLLLQSDVEEACVAMRNMFERYGSDAFALAPQHSTCPVFYSRPMGPSATLDGVDGAASVLPSSEAVAAQGLGPEAAVVVAPAEAASYSGAAAEVRGEAAVATPHSTVHESGLTAAHASGAAPHPAVNYAAAAAGAARHAMAAAAAAAVRQAEDGASCDGASTSNDESDGDGGDDDFDADISSMVSEWAKGGWLVDNPIGTPTEREHYVGQQGLPVYRVLLVRL